MARTINNGFAPATTRKAAQLLRAALEDAVNDGLVGSNPARNLVLPRIAQTEMRFANADQIWLLFETIDPRWNAMVLTTAYTGLRLGEVIGLKGDDMNLLHKTLTVSRQLTESNGHIEFAPVKTAASRRSVQLPSLLCEELANHIAAYPVSPEGLVFQAADGGPIRRSNWRRRVWVPAVTAAGLDGFRFHDLRHSHAAMLIAEGEHPKVIQARLGHASISTTLDTYGHLFEGLDGAAAARLNDVLAASHSATGDSKRLRSA